MRNAHVEKCVLQSEPGPKFFSGFFSKQNVVKKTPFNGSIPVISTHAKAHVKDDKQALIDLYNEMVDYGSVVPTKQPKNDHCNHCCMPTSSSEAYESSMYPHRMK
jgi:hypothetical protein